MDTGISGNIFSAHYDDQMKLFDEDQYIEMIYGSQNLHKNKYIIQDIWGTIPSLNHLNLASRTFESIIKIYIYI